MLFGWNRCHSLLAHFSLPIVTTNEYDMVSPWLNKWMDERTNRWMDGLVLSFREPSANEKICHLTTIGQNQVVWHWLHHIQTNSTKWAPKWTGRFLFFLSLSVFIFIHNLDMNHFSKSVWPFPSSFLWPPISFHVHFGGINTLMTNAYHTKWPRVLFQWKITWFRQFDSHSLQCVRVNH